jgi:hydroxymethylglutaryl-CoA lyase
MSIARSLYTIKYVDLVEIVEVSPRDGLQNERIVLPTQTKVRLVERCAAAGVRRVEATSFVRPDRIPQLADAEALIASLHEIPGLDAVTLSALALNRRGFERALAAGIREINAVVICTETFSERNQGMSVDRAVDTWLDIAAAARATEVNATLTLSAAFGCPFEGEVSTKTVIDLFSRVIEGAPAEVVLADTIGVGVPRRVRELVTECRAIAPTLRLRAHFHDTRSTGIANAIAAVESGVTVLDASAGGIGGCPFAPGASGNVATEDLLYALHRSGWHTGIDPIAMADTGTWVATELDLDRAPAALGRARWFGELPA